MLPKSPGDPPLPFIELASGQAEEHFLAREAISTGRAAGVGLLRMEFILYNDPGMDQEGLTDHLAQLLSGLRSSPVSVRLADWSKEKPPSADTVLQSWNGERGLAGLVGTPALQTQLRALDAAAKAADHGDVWCVAPFVESTKDLSHARALLGGTSLKLGAMLESVKAFTIAHNLQANVEGFWIGFGDLLNDVGCKELAFDSISVLDDLTDSPIFLCGPVVPNQSSPHTRVP